MQSLTEFLRSSYARMRAYIGRGVPQNAPLEQPPAAAQNSDQAQIEQALAFHQRGQLDEAQTLYQALLLKHPGHAELLHRLGMVQGQRGDFAAAMAFIEQAIAADPNSADAHCSLGNCFKGLRQYEEALACYDRALALRPNDADTWSNRGATLGDLKRPEAALQSYERALALNPSHVPALDNRGAALRVLKRPEEALVSHDQALIISPDYAPAHYNRGLALADLGRLEEARAGHERALALQPDHVDALTGLGAVLTDMGESGQALPVYDRALVIRPDYADALIKRGVALSVLNRHEEALISFDKALALDPGNAPGNAIAYYNRGIALGELKRYEEALQCCDSALKSNPAFSAALHHRGNLLSSLKRYAAALESYDQALAINPDNADILINRSTALSELKRYEAALASCDLALSIRPGDADALNNRGSALRNLGRHEEALVCHEQLLEQRPDSLEALVSRGLTLNALNRHQDALDAFDRALHVDPDRASAYFCRGIILASLARHEEALNSYERALDLQPDYIEAHHNRGTELLALRRHEAALHSFGKALALNPDFLPSLCTRGELLSYLKRAEDAIKDYTRLLALSPDYDFAQGRLLHAKTICCDWRDLDALSSAISENLLQGKKSAEPFSCIGTFSCALLMKRCAEIYAAEKFPRTPRDASAYKPRAENKIRVGYVAGEFRRHATSFLLAELFEKHDTSRFELFAFDNGWNDGSVVRKRLENAFTEIVDISRLGDWEAVAKIRDKGVDILVDLNGHVGRKRTGIFSHRPAPIQVNWLGYPGTMGVDFMDYIIADAHLIPDGHEVYYSEKIVRLPDTYQANDSKREIAGPAPSRAEAGLPPSGFVFCCFNNNFKITPEVFDVWMRLLRQVEHSVLWLFVDNAAACRNLRAEAAARGVTPDRLVFAAPAKLPDHLARYQLADLFLDTLPCNAHTTASDALWEGLPLLTCMGTTFAGRVAGSLLHAVGLPELVTNNLADYEALALRLATTPALLADLRQRLARNKSTHALFDSDRFRKNIESAYLTMMERWSRGEAPVSFSVNSANESIRL